jgi:TolA-binding protein
MKNYFKLLALLTCMAFLSACPLTTREDMEHQQDDERQIKEQVSTIQRGRADNDQRLTDLQSDMRVIAGRVDAVEHNDQQGIGSTRVEIENLKKQIAAQNDRMKLIEQHIDATEARLMSAVQSLGTASQASPHESGVSESAKETGHAKKSEGPLGEADSLLSSHEYKRAIVQYENYLTKKPHGALAAEATYKIGYCFAEMGMKKDAKEFYQETMESFPGTSSAKKAKARLSQLK